MHDLEEKQSREVREISLKLELQEEATNYHKGRKMKLREITRKLTDRKTRTEGQRAVVLLWRDFVYGKKRRRHMNVYCARYASRRFPHTVFNAWKDCTSHYFREQSQDLLTQTAENTTLQIREQCFSELNALRSMVEDLTEDLRKETLAKNTLRFKFEGALMRGMNTISAESLSLQQDTLERDREISLLTRSLNYASLDRSQD